MLSDAAFGTLFSKISYDADFETIQVEDIMRTLQHTYIVLEKHSDHVIIAKGSYNGKVH